MDSNSINFSGEVFPKTKNLNVSLKFRAFNCSCVTRDTISLKILTQNRGLRTKTKEIKRAHTSPLRHVITIEIDLFCPYLSFNKFLLDVIDTSKRQTTLQSGNSV